VESPVSCIRSDDGKPPLALSSAGENDLHSGDSVSTLSLRTIPHELHTISPVKVSVIGGLPHEEHNSSSGPEWSDNMVTKLPGRNNLEAKIVQWRLTFDSKENRFWSCTTFCKP
jgi:hypothetical protein